MGFGCDVVYVEDASGKVHLLTLDEPMVLVDAYTSTVAQHGAPCSATDERRIAEFLATHEGFVRCLSSPDKRYLVDSCYRR